MEGITDSRYGLAIVFYADLSAEATTKSHIY